MAETKPKGDPVFLTIGEERITLPGVTSLNTDDELLAASKDWIAKNYKGDAQFNEPVVFRTPLMDEKGGFKPGEEIVVSALPARPFEGSVLGTAAEAVRNMIGVPGIDPETMQALTAGDGFAAQFAQNALQTAQPFLQRLELASAAPSAAIAGLSQLAYNLGLGEQDPRRTAAEVEEAINVGGLPLGTLTGPRVPTARQLLRETPLSAPMQTIAEPVTPAPIVPRTLAKPKAPELPEAPVAAAEIPEATVAPSVPRTRMPEEQGMAGIQALGEKGQTRPIATQEVTDKVLRFETDYLKETGLSRPENLPLKDFFFMHFDAGTLPRERTLELAKRAGIEPEDLADFVAGSQQTATEAGRILRARMVMSKYITTEAGNIAGEGVRTPDELGLWKRTTDATRGLMVSQLATTMRNTIGSVARLPIDAATSLTSTAINTAMNPFRQDPVGTRAWDAFAVLTDRLQPSRNKKFYEQLRTYYPKVNKELNSTYAADVAGDVGKDKFGKIEKVVNTLNLVNRVTETTTRNIMFPVYLRRELTRRGMNIDEIVDTKRLNEIPQDAIDNALRETMDFTYGASPKTDHAMGKAADGFIRMVEALGPAGVTIAPFPRFMVSALRFQAEYNPLGVTRLLSKKNRDAMRAGDPEVLSKALVGTGLIGAAYLFRNSDSAGEKWSEAKLPDGRVIDMKAYFPIPQYLLVADIIKRYNDGVVNGQTLDQAIDAKEIFQAVTGSQFRAGTGLYVVDQFIKDLSDAGSDPKKYLDIIGKFAADYGAAIFTPLQTFKDFYAEYNPEEAIYRDTKDSFLGTLVRPIPGAQTALGIPAAESPTREAPMTTENPALRQLLGVAIRPAKNIVESELDKLGLSAFDIGSKTGDTDIDRIINRDLGIIAERGIAPLLESPQYQQLDNVQKSAAIKEIYTKARATATAKFNAENPELALLKKYKGMKREQQIMLNDRVTEATGMSAPELLRQISKAPLIKTQAQYDALPDGTKYTDPGDYKVYTKGE